MTDTRSPATWLRSLAGLLALTGALVLGGCGGGSGAPNNAFQPFGLLNTPIDVYSGFPAGLEVSGGLAPYRAFSSNPAVLPVVETNAGSPIVLFANAVTATTIVQITVQDSMGRVATGNAVVRPAPMANSMVITPNQADCGINAICSGQTGTASVNVIGGVGREVRFDVVSGPYGIVSPAAGAPLVNTLTVRSDSAGNANVILRAFVNAPTQFAQLRVTEVASGQHLVGSFLIQQITDGTAILSVVPNEATITSVYKGECSSGFPTDYYIYGGTPPYRVASTFPTAVTLVNAIVPASGRAFTAITNGTCVDPLTFTIVDATGRQVTSTLINKEGSTERPTVTPPDLAVTPSSYPSQASCAGTSLRFIVTGGTLPYGGLAVNSLGGSVPVTADAGTADPGDFIVGPLPGGASTTTIVFKDQSQPQKTVSATITCTS